MAKTFKWKGPKRIAPRLADGTPRDNIAHRLPPHIKEALRMKAYVKQQSVGWMLEQAIIQYFGYKRPEYVQPKKPTPAEVSEARGTKKAG